MSEIFKIKSGKIVGVRTSVFTIFNHEKYDPRTIPAAWQEFFSKSVGTKLGTAKSFYGASIPSMSIDAPMDYYAGALIDSDAEIPAGFESVDIPEGAYLAVPHVGPITNIVASYQKAYMESLGASGKEMRPAPHLEIYDPALNPMDDDYQMIIGIPIN